MERREDKDDRRSQGLKSLYYGSIYKRRRDNRRDADDQVMILDWHDAGLFMLALSIVIMSCMDAMFTLNLLALGGEEINLAMQALLNVGTGTFLVVKYCATGAGIVFLVAFARVKLVGLIRVRRVLEAICAIYACLMIYELYLLVAVASEVTF